MKFETKNSLLALVALLSAAVMGGFGGLSAKVALREVPPLTVLFFRINVMILVMLPFVGKTFGHLWQQRKKLFLLGVLWTGNVALFIVGIKYTTVVVSSLLYAFVPVVVLILQALILGNKVKSYQTIGVVLGLIGALVMLSGSWNGESGSLFGNILISIAVVSWSMYLIFSKRFNLHISPAGLTFGSAVGAWLLVGILMLFSEGVSGFVGLMSLSGGGWAAIWYIALAVGVGMIFLGQWGLKHATALSFGVMQYVGMVVGSLSGIIFLGEKLTFQLIVGGSVMLIGVFMVSTLPVISGMRGRKTVNLT